MRFTVDIPENDLKDIMRFTGEKKKGPAIARIVADTLMLKRRRELSNEVISGKAKFDFPHYDEMQELDRNDPWDK